MNEPKTYTAIFFQFIHLREDIDHQKAKVGTGSLKKLRLFICLHYKNLDTKIIL